MSIFDLFKKQPKENVFHPKDRVLYKFWDGKDQVTADPLVLFKKLMEKGKEVSHNMKLSNSNDSNSTQGHSNLVANARWIFNVKPLELGGLTEQECVNLLDHFLSWCSDITNKFPIRPIPREEPIPEPPKSEPVKQEPPIPEKPVEIPPKVDLFAPQQKEPLPPDIFDEPGPVS